jgi:hypothetical protein
MPDRDDHAKSGALRAMPVALRIAVTAAVLLAMAGALYIIVARGDALLIELGKLGRVFCL